jgi:hypothetical protein
LEGAREKREERRGRGKRKRRGRGDELTLIYHTKRMHF